MQVSGQQMPQYSQYMFNDFIINPAIAGVHDHYQIRTNHRFQWAGMNDPPITNSIAFYGPHSKMDMGFGGSIFTDITGPTSRTGVSGSYAYNILLFNDIRLSAGLSFSILQYRVDGTQFDFEVLQDQFDPVIQPIVSTNYLPDAATGIYIYGDDFYAGISSAQLLNNKLHIFNLDDAVGINRLKTHVFITGGYRYEVDPEWVIEPSAIVKLSAPKQYKFEATARVEWMRMVWLGVGYRMHEAVNIIAGYNYSDKFYFGYSYDIGVSHIRFYNSGSHEIMIGYKFDNLK